MAPISQAKHDLQNIGNMLAAGDASTRHGVENSQDIHIYLCSFVYVGTPPLPL